MRDVTSDCAPGLLDRPSSSSSPFAHQAGRRKLRTRIKNNDKRGMQEALPIFIPLISVARKDSQTRTYAKSFKQLKIHNQYNINLMKICYLKTIIRTFQANGIATSTVGDRIVTYKT